MSSDHRPVSSLFRVEISKRISSIYYSSELNFSSTRDSHISDQPGSFLVSPSTTSGSGSSNSNANQMTNSAGSPSNSTNNNNSNISNSSSGEIMARVLYDYQPVDPKELRLQANQIIKVLKMDDSGWWKAAVNDSSPGNGRKEGWIPKDYVEIVGANPSSTSSNEESSSSDEEEGPANVSNSDSESEEEEDSSQFSQLHLTEENSSPSNTNNNNNLNNSNSSNSSNSPISSPLHNPLFPFKLKMNSHSVGTFRSSVLVKPSKDVNPSHVIKEGFLVKVSRVVFCLLLISVSFRFI